MHAMVLNGLHTPLQWSELADRQPEWVKSA